MNRLAVVAQRFIDGMRKCMNRRGRLLVAGDDEAEAAVVLQVAYQLGHPFHGSC